MPYIPQSQRANLDPAIGELANRIKLTCAQDKAEPDGMLNYAFTRLLQALLTGPSYLQLERATGCLECCKLELQRRATAPYEDTKIKQNGDVYG